MPRINLLDKSVAELIAAGEVVERPASVIKELVENSIDASADRITVEIMRGGVSLMRITDNGCGIAREDVPLAFMRHATSKIRAIDDLDAILTLGFRGEALAATSSVSRIELLTKTKEEPTGTHYCIEGGVETLYEEAGCPEGTTIVVTDLFYNTPARMKFLKKDVSEGNAVAAVMDRIALSHPEIAFKLIRDGKTTLTTSGDGKLESAVYSVLGRDFARSVINVNGKGSSVEVNGVVCKPVSCRQSRAWQFVFLNGRFVHSGTVSAAVEQAYKNSAMVGKFPAFVLNINVPAGIVDVNVHPAKTQVRFSDERIIFDAVYYAVKNALSQGDTRPAVTPSRPIGGGFAHMSTQEYRQHVMTVDKKMTERPSSALTEKFLSNIAATPKEKVSQPQENTVSRLNDDDKLPFMRDDVKEFISHTEKIAFDDTSNKSCNLNEDINCFESCDAAPEKTSSVYETAEPMVESEPIRFIGEAFKTYIIVEKGDSVFLIDKHAAHERILYEKLKKEQTVEMQDLLIPEHVRLSREEYDIIVSNIDALQKVGFDAEDFGNGVLLIRAVPAALSAEDASAVLSEAAEALNGGGLLQLDTLDKIYHTVACKAATKAGYRSDEMELMTLAKRVLENKDIMYCPHGRPVAFELKRTDLEKQFGRIQ